MGAVLLGGLVFAVVAGPVLVWDLPGGVDRTLPTVGIMMGAMLAVARVVRVLRQFALRGTVGRGPRSDRQGASARGRGRPSFAP